MQDGRREGNQFHQFLGFAAAPKMASESYDPSN
jgi:hypothetical protein